MTELFIMLDKLLKPILLVFNISVILIILYLVLMPVTTKVVKFKRGEKTITFVGVCHVGKEIYYDSLQDILDNFSPSQILYEGVIVKDSDSTAKKDMSKLDDSKDYMCEKLDLVEQHKHLLLNEDDCVWADMYYDDINQMYGNTGIEEELGDSPREKSIDANKHITKIIFRASMNLSNIRNNREYSVILDVRNVVVMLKAFEVLETEDDIAILYGDAHRKGITKYLEKLGFEQVESKSFKPF